MSGGYWIDTIGWIKRKNSLDAPFNCTVQPKHRHKKRCAHPNQPDAIQ